MSAWNCCNLKSITIENSECEIADHADTISNGYDADSRYYFNGTIYGYENSTAQAHAEKYGYAFELIENAEEPSEERPTGDANNDGKLTVSDAAFIARTLAKRETIDVQINPYADYNNDGKVTVSDAAAIARELAKAKSK